MTVTKTSKATLTIRVLGALLAAMFAILAAGCAPQSNTLPSPAPSPSGHSAPAPGVAVPAPPRVNS